MELEKQRIELIKAQQSSETTTTGGGGGHGELTRQRLLRERAKEALRVIEAKANANVDAGVAAASPHMAASTAAPASSSPSPTPSSGAGTQMQATGRAAGAQHRWCHDGGGCGAWHGI